MEQLCFAGNAYLKINSLVETPLHEFMAVERSGLWAPVRVWKSINHQKTCFASIFLVYVLNDHSIILRKCTPG